MLKIPTLKDHHYDQLKARISELERENAQLKVSKKRLTDKLAEQKSKLVHCQKMLSKLKNAYGPSTSAQRKAETRAAIQAMIEKGYSHKAIVLSGYPDHTTRVLLKQYREKIAGTSQIADK